MICVVSLCMFSHYLATLSNVYTIFHSYHLYFGGCVVHIRCVNSSRVFGMLQTAINCVRVDICREEWSDNAYLLSFYYYCADISVVVCFPFACIGINQPLEGAWDFSSSIYTNIFMVIVSLSFKSNQFNGMKENLWRFRKNQPFLIEISRIESVYQPFAPDQKGCDGV